MGKRESNSEFDMQLRAAKRIKKELVSLAFGGYVYPLPSEYTADFLQKEIAKDLFLDAVLSVEKESFAVWTFNVRYDNISTEITDINQYSDVETKVQDVIDFFLKIHKFFNEVLHDK